jgi:gluconate 2-dehydrogenase subunit 3-like protein
VAAPAPVVPAGLEFFSAANYATAVVLFERLFPADESAGATDLGVAHYVDHALASTYAEYQPLMREGLDQLDSEATHSFGAPFYQLTPARQDELVRAFEASGQQSLVSFVQLATALVIEGALADPIYRGSKSTGGWELVGFIPDECARPDSRAKR